MIAGDLGSILHVDLRRKESSKKSYPDLKKFVGGVGVSSKLLLDSFDLDPVTLAVGPLNGFFPFASKTCATFVDDGKFVDTYAGGRLSVRLGYSGVRAIVFEGKSSDPVFLSIIDGDVSFASSDSEITKLGVPGQRSVVEVIDDGVVVDRFFKFGEQALAKKLLAMGIAGIVVSGTLETNLEKLVKYDKQYNEVLGMINEMSVQASFNPSCSGCPMGCSKSLLGETGGDVLVHSLVSCIYAENIYSKIPTVFACLASLGYDYVHEDLENLSDLVHANIGLIYEKISDSKLETKQE